MDLYQVLTMGDGGSDSSEQPEPPTPYPFPDSAATPDAQASVEPEGKALAEAFGSDQDATSISEHGLEFIATWEGFLSHATWDPYGHVWTIGIGETSGVHQGMVWTYSQALADLRRRMAANYEPYVRAAIGSHAYTQNEFDALCSFVWNVGPGSMSSSWTIGAAVRSGNKAAVAAAFAQYDRAGGVVLLGLQRRRSSERALFLTPEPPPPETMHYLRYPETGVHHVHERRLCQHYDELRKHGVKNRKALKPVRADLRDERAYVWKMAHDHKVDGKPSWGVDWRGWRWQQLNKRCKGGVAKPSV